MRKAYFALLMSRPGSTKREAGSLLFLHPGVSDISLHSNVDFPLPGQHRSARRCTVEDVRVRERFNFLVFLSLRIYRVWVSIRGKRDAPLISPPR